MDDRELLAELLELGELTVPQHPPKGQTVSTEFVPMEAWADFMMVWSFVDTFQYVWPRPQPLVLRVCDCEA
jgi:hypothetical protein